MFDETLTMKTIELGRRALGGATLREKVIANNIANVNTPGFKRSTVRFEDQLKELLDSSEDSDKLPAYITHPRHIPFNAPLNINEFNPIIVQSSDTIFRNDKNNVNIDQEMADLSKNNLYYNVMATSISQRFRILRSIISGVGNV